MDSTDGRNLIVSHNYQLANKNIKTLKKKEKNPKEDEAISALQVLGYNNREIEKVIESIDTEGLTLEEIIKIGLKKLAIK